MNSFDLKIPKVFSWKILLLCLLCASFFEIPAFYEKFTKPETSQVLYPFSTSDDSVLFASVIKRASTQELQGDPFLWEHRNNSNSVFAHYNFWLNFLGKIAHVIGFENIFRISIIFLALWIFAIYALGIYLGLEAGISMVVAVIIALCSTSWGYQFLWLGASFRHWSFFASENLKLYPSLISMTVYALAAAASYWALAKKGFYRMLIAGFLVAATFHGRPFNWMVLSIFLGLVSGVSWLKKDRGMFRQAFFILLVSLLCVAPFFLGMLRFMSEHQVEWIDRLARGHLQVKNWSHYVKYSAVSIVFLSPFILVLKNILRWGNPDPEIYDLRFRFLSLLVISTFMGHLHTLKDRITINSYGYFFVFDIVPWVLFASLVILVYLIRRFRPAFIASSRWFAVAVGLAFLIQVFFLAIDYPKQSSGGVSQDRKKLYEYIDAKTPQDSVIMSFTSASEMVVFTGRWNFLNLPSVVTFTVGAPTTELLDRFLMTKLLLDGTLDDLKPYFSENGMAVPKYSNPQSPPRDLFWYHIMFFQVGNQTFMIHPIKNKGDLQVRKLELPDSLKSINDFVLYFDKPYRDLFSRRNIRPQYSVEEAVALIRKNYRLDYILIPKDFPIANPFNEIRERLEHSHATTLVFTNSVGDRLYKVR